MTASCALVIPAYNEANNLPILIKKIFDVFEDDFVIIVVDDSPAEIAEASRTLCVEVAGSRSKQLTYLTRQQKGGRGSAVNHGFKMSLRLYPQIKKFIECDADGSHRVEDIERIFQVDDSFDVVIGSRYLPQSTIIGWTRLRRYMSRFLNWLIPLLLGLSLSDVTNGLRRYSRPVIEVMLKEKQVNKNFMYLSEQLVLLHRHSFTLKDVPITFIERQFGKSSVGFSLLVDSIVALLRLSFKRWRN